MDEESLVGTTLLDFNKVFDKAYHTRLNPKLCAMGIHEDFVNWTMQFLTNRKQVIRVFRDDGSIFF